MARAHNFPQPQKNLTQSETDKPDMGIPASTAHKAHDAPPRRRCFPEENFSRRRTISSRFHGEHTLTEKKTPDVDISGSMRSLKGIDCHSKEAAADRPYAFDGDLTGPYQREKEKTMVEMSMTSEASL